MKLCFGVHVQYSLHVYVHIAAHSYNSKLVLTSIHDKVNSAIIFRLTDSVSVIVRLSFRSGSLGRGFDPEPRQTKENGTSGYLDWCSAL